MAEAMTAPPDLASHDGRSARQDARFKALFRLMDRQIRGLPAYKLARVLSAVVALACGAAALALVAAGQSRAVFALSVQALGWVSWTTGATLGVSAANGVRAGAATPGVEALVLQRGFTSGAVTSVELIASALRLALLVAAPSVTLGSLSIPLAGSLTGALGRALACAGMLGYALLFGVSMVLLARTARALAPHAGRVTFVFFLLGPLVLAELQPGFPSIPGLFAAVRDQLLAAGLGA
jgi:hypothetical protein